jgi:hypothetical protein
LKALVDHERIYANNVPEVREKLASDHVAAIEMLRDLSAHRNAAELETIGSPGRVEKKASASGAITGARVADFDDTASGQAFRNILTGGSGR